jgi:hypothetical protein
MTTHPQYAAALSAAFAAATCDIDCELSGGERYLTAYGYRAILGMAAHSAAEELGAVFDEDTALELGEAIARAAFTAW